MIEIGPHLAHVLHALAEAVVTAYAVAGCTALLLLISLLHRGRP